MSRPFDDTNDWWRDELRALGQIVHQAHIYEKNTWRLCTKASCSRIRAIIEESKRDTGIQEIFLDDIVSIQVRRRKS